MTVILAEEHLVPFIGRRGIENSNVIVLETMEHRLYREANCPGT
jgi:hypothetical protein